MSDTARPTATNAGARRQALLCRTGAAGGDSTGRRLVAFPIDQVVETMRPLPVQALPGLPGYVAGVAMIRGAGVPVLDLAALLGIPPDPGSPKRFVTLSSAGSEGGSDGGSDGGRQLAVLVDAVLDVRPLAAGDLPPLLAGVEHGLVTAIGALDPDLLYLLEAAQLVDDETWAALAEAGGGRS